MCREVIEMKCVINRQGAPFFMADIHAWQIPRVEISAFIARHCSGVADIENGAMCQITNLAINRRERRSDQAIGPSQN